MEEIEFRHLRYFIAVAEELSFTKAAQRLRIAQPSLSLQIRQLEDRLSTTLIVRKPHLELTPAGDKFLASARQVLRHAHSAIESTRKIGRGKRGVIHLGLASSAALTRIPALLQRFIIAHSELDIRISEMHSADQVRALRNGLIDVGISRETTTESGFIVREVVREPFVLVLPAGHALASAKRFRLRSCAAESFVLFPRASAPMLYDQIVSVCRASGFAPKVEIEAREWHTIVALVAAGMGISIAPESVSTLRIRNASFRALPPSGHHARLFVCHSEQNGNAEVQVLVDALTTAGNASDSNRKRRTA